MSPKLRALQLEIRVIKMAIHNCIRTKKRKVPEMTKIMSIIFQIMSEIILIMSDIIFRKRDVDFFVGERVISKS